MTPGFKYVLSLLLICIAASPLVAQTQSELTVRVQVNRTPQGNYPVKLYQFQTMPGLVIVTITNRTQSPYTIYLNGSVTGDNGVKVTTSKNYQPATIDIKPFETKILNAIEVGSLFDPNSLVYSSGNNNIKPSVYGEQGLPEGAYQVCVRAFNKTNRQPVSDEEPMGCSNIFTITTLEPPTILTPFDEAEIAAEPVQNIPFRWTTPPGAPPSVEYRIRIVELFNNRPANDAMFSTPNPFFETTVRGVPLLLYSMQYPRLQEGRSYAMMVTATDPMGAAFRNKGRSEVVRFLYGKKKEEAAVPGSQTAGQTAAPAEYATHAVKGRLSWAFRKSEQAVHTIYSGGNILAGVKNAVLYAGFQSDQFVKQTAVTPMIQFNAVNAMNTDNTLVKSYAVSKFGGVSKVNGVYNVAGATPAAPPPPPANQLSASHSVQQESSLENSSSDTAAERHPLANVKLTLSTEAGNNLPAQLLATGETNAEGEFSLKFLHPVYSAQASGGYLKLSIQTNDFETNSFRVPVSILKQDQQIDIGHYVLLARSYRFLAKVGFEAGDETEALRYGIHVYREAAAIKERPWLMLEGKNKQAEKKIVVVDGKEMIEVFSDSITAKGSSKSGNIGSMATLEFSGPGRLFYGGNLTVKIIPSSNAYAVLNSSVSILNAAPPAGKILQTKASYQVKLRPQRVEGQVDLVMGELIRIQGATVRVMYKTTDVVPGSTSSMISGVSNVKATANTTALNNYLGSFTSNKTNDPGVTKVSALVYTLGALTTTPPVMVQQSGNAQAKSQLVTSIIQPAPPVSKVPEGFTAITVSTDEMGRYYASLPRLKGGAEIRVEVVTVPAEFRSFAIRAKSKPFENPGIGTIGSGGLMNMDFSVIADVAEVIAHVVDDKGNSLPGSRLLFKGQQIAEAGEGAMARFKIYPGKHAITIVKEGYVTKTIDIDIAPVTKNNNNNNSNDKAFKTQWAGLSLQQKQEESIKKIAEAPSVKASIAKGFAFSPAMFGSATATPIKNMGLATTQFSSSLAAVLGNAIDKAGAPLDAPAVIQVDLKDIGFLNRISGKVRFRVIDEVSKNPVLGVKISLFDTTNTTDAKGEWFYEGFGGNTTVTILPPGGYVADQKIYLLKETGAEQLELITLKKGVLVTGKVSAGGSPLANATVFADEKEFNSVTTDAQGLYNLYLAAGEHSISARRQNYVGADSIKNVPAAGLTQHFNLKGGNGKNYGTLLGFAVELSAADPLPGGQEKWTGRLVHLNAVNKDVLQTDASLKIPFSNLIVSFDGAGNAVPAGNIKTDISYIPIKLFGYLPAKLLSDDVISIVKTTDGKGQIAGNIRVDLGAVQGYRGWSLDETASLLLAKNGATTAERMVLFNTSSLSTTINYRYSIISASTAKAGGKLYGFAIGINNGAVVDKDGISLSGIVATPAAGPVKSINVNITKFYLNRSFNIGPVEVQVNDLPSLEIAGWKASLASLLFNENGFKVGGQLSVTLPRSGSSGFSFSDLAISKDGLFGGKFTLPESGIDILSVANLSTDGVPLSFGRVGSTNVYRIGGKASLKVNVAIMEKTFKVPVFEVLTNGNFSVQVPANYSTQLGPFGFSVSNLYINTTESTPYIGVQGNFKADLDFLKFEMADIKVKASSSGPTFSVEKIGVKLDVPVVKTEAFVTFKDNGFEGDGSLSIPGTMIKGSMGFKYFKRPAGVELGAKFFANLPPIPIGAIVSLEGIGGGFEYKTGTPNAGFTVDVRGKLAFTGLGTLLALDPVGLTVSSAGVLKGYGHVKVASYLNMANAEVIFDGPESCFTVKVSSDMSPMEGLMSQKMQGALVISAKKDDEYAFLGCAVDVKLLGLINNSGRFGLAVGLKDPVTRGGLVGSFFDRAPVEYMQQRFSGVYIDVASQLGIPRERALGFNLYVASAKVWASSAFQAGLLLNFAENAYRLKFGGKFDAGAEVSVLTVSAGISAGLCYLVEGGRNPSLGWNFSATATGDFGVVFGWGPCNPGCNEIDGSLIPPCLKVRVCGHASLDFGYSERNGVRFSARAGGSGVPCF